MMIRRVLAVVTVLFTVLWVLAFISLIGSFCGLEDSHLQLASNCYAATRPGYIVFFNNEKPYLGSIIQISDGKDDAFPSIEKTTFDMPGIYYRDFQWQDNGHFNWWTLRISDLYLLMIFGVLPAWWLWRRWHRGRRLFSISSSPNEMRP